ncbi:cytochrome c [Psychrosphaera sp. 1_MG-2023]|uniref:c-type cytochrome n=1 Tax=Psychrosphaera sp. 1_MG-2023 TaxID=3062643 RepID=UPI0026E43295|nr:cytochrome c [Psychrosphaera sp. 1_MG-2023]MDO6719946.1 cytochrome c [Psychrosphaera sp. 1_MG-2023]
MKFGSKLVITALLTASAASVIAEPASSQKQANKAVEWRQAMFQLIASNMGSLGAMAKGKIPVDAATVEKNATRINQLANMIDDYTSVDTRKFDVKTEALDKVWEDRADFDKKIQALINASSTLAEKAKSGDTSAIKSAIGGIGKSCKGCHDVYKQD